MFIFLYGLFYLKRVEGTWVSDKSPVVVDNIAFILLEPRCVQLNVRRASLLFIINSGDNRYISRTIWELRPRNKKMAGTAGQPATPLRPPLKESKEEQPEGNSRQAEGRLC